ncbi:MAG: lysine--tRNA ligase [Acidobacteriota bacterium]
METARQDIVQHRRTDVERLEAAGLALYPDRFEATYPNISDIPHEVGKRIRVAGRVTAIRAFGKLAFVKLIDVSGRIQVAISVGHVGKEVFKLFTKSLKVGDFLGAAGETFHTKTGEFTVQAEELAFLGMAFRLLPEKWHGLRDVEMRHRRRYLDIIANPSSRDAMLARCRLISSMRRIFEEAGFFEVETPILSTIQAGALARPFVTHHKTLDVDLFLRIAPETYLKRANAAGFNRVFEFARCFRNEGISPEHLQEFTMLEFYVCYWDFRDNMEFTRRFLQRSLQETFGRLEFEVPGASEGETIQLDFSGHWPEVDFRESIRQACGIDLRRLSDVGRLVEAIAQAGIELDSEDLESGNPGRLMDALYKRTVRRTLIQPTFLTGHPLELSPLARQNDADPQVADRFQLVVRGTEWVNAYSELVDPLEQRRRLTEQSQLKAGGDQEAMGLDEDYLLCMEHGMPCISGNGIGIDRLLMTVLGLPNIKDALLFPLLRKEGR